MISTNNLVRNNYGEKNSIRTNTVKRGQVWMVDLGDYIGSVQGGERPCVIIQNDVGNKYSPTTIVIPLTSRMSKADLPTHTLMTNEKFLNSLSLALGEQTRAIDLKQLKKYLGDVSEDTMRQINVAIETAMGLRKSFDYKIAYEYLDQLKNINVLIKNLGDLKELKINKSFITKKFVDYCNEHLKNPIDVKDNYLKRRNIYIITENKSYC